MLYGGVPAKPLKNVEGAQYFEREQGFVGR
jgi:hypothetical protein